MLSALGSTKKIEEVRFQVPGARVLVFHHRRPDLSRVTSNPIHHVLRVTLKDNSVWAIDMAGAQYGQREAVLGFADYSREYVAKMLVSRPFVKHIWPHPGYHFGTRPEAMDTGGLEGPSIDGPWMSSWQNLVYQQDELAEWEFHHVTVGELLKAKAEDHQKLSKMLVDHLRTAAREFVKKPLEDPSSTAKPILVNNFGFNNPTEEDLGRMERKAARKTAAMTLDERHNFLADFNKGEKGKKMMFMT